MGQHPTPDPDPDKHEDLEALGASVYEGSGLSVRALTAEELQRFLDAHTGQPTRPLGSGWAALDPPGHPAGVPWTAPEAAPALPGPPPSAAAKAAVGSPGRSALAQYRRRRSQELAAWTRSLVWRAPLVAAAGLTGSALATQAGLARTPATVAGLAAAALVGWPLRFRPSTQARTWQRGARGERQTARLLDRLSRHGYQVFHDLAMPGSPANIDHLVVGPSGVFVIDSKQWTGQVHQSAERLIWHNHHHLDRPGHHLLAGPDPRSSPGHPRRPAAVCASRPRPRRRPARPGRGHRSRHPAALGARLRPRAVRRRRGAVRGHRQGAATAGGLNLAEALRSWVRRRSGD